MAHWLIQDNVFNEAFFDKMLALFERMDIPYSVVKSVPMSGEILSENLPDPSTKVVAIGSYSFTNKVKETWSPGSWTNEKYDYRVWSNNWSKVLNTPAEVTTFGNVQRTEVPFFIRPCADDKLFTGTVVEDLDEFKEWQESVFKVGTYTELNEDSPVVVGDAYKIEDEYRFIVVDKKVITGSSYSRHKGQKEITEGENPDLWNFVRERIAEWVPSDVFTIDIAVSAGNFWVLEMGNFNSAGLYQCDVQKIVFAIEEFLDKNI